MTLFMLSHVELRLQALKYCQWGISWPSETNPPFWLPITIIILPEIIYSMVLLVTSDKEEVNVDNEVVECSMLLKTMLEGVFLSPSPLIGDKMIFSGYRDPVQPKIPLPDVSSKVLKKVSDFSFFSYS